MLGLARAFGAGVLPRPQTRDAVFFDLPIVGLVIYPESLAIPLAIVMCIAVGAAAMRVRRGVLPGIAASLAAVLVSGVVALALSAIAMGWLARLPWSGNPEWRGLYAAAWRWRASPSCSRLRRSPRSGRTTPGCGSGAIIVWPQSASRSALRRLARATCSCGPRCSRRSRCSHRDSRRVAEWVAVAVTMLHARWLRVRRVGRDARGRGRGRGRAGRADRDRRAHCASARRRHW